MKRNSRLKEPSSWAGIAAALAAIIPVSGPAAPYLTAAAGICGAVAVFLRETGGESLP